MPEICEEKATEQIFFIFLFWWLTYSVNRFSTSTKVTHYYLLACGNLLTSYITGNKCYVPYKILEESLSKWSNSEMWLRINKFEGSLSADYTIPSKENVCRTYVRSERVYGSWYLQHLNIFHTMNAYICMYVYVCMLNLHNFQNYLFI